MIAYLNSLGIEEQRERPIIRLIIAGDDRDLHSFTQTFCQVFSERRLELLD